VTCTIEIVALASRCRTIRASRWGALYVVLAAGCSSFSSSQLVIDRVDPASAPNTADVAVQIDGAGFHLPITSSLDQGTTIVGTMTVTVGNTQVADAARRSDQLIEGTVTAGLPVGSYDVTVTIGDRSDVLVNGYTVTGFGSSAEPLHLATGDGTPGGAPLMLTGTVTIDTSAPSISVVLPAGDSLDVRPQLGGGPDLAVLHVDALTVASGANVIITGSRPFVIVAGGDVVVDGTLDAGSHGATPGPGGAGTGSGSGAGAAGVHGTNASDTGGAGAGYGEAGANGGTMTGCVVMTASGGAAFGDAAITQLVGGSGGGLSSGTACLPLDVGGGGGGALQISSATQIVIGATGQINAGGGGGTGGTDCNSGTGDVNSAAGGGSGGAIVLQAPAISNAGVIAANGGGGGGSSATSMGSGMPGQDGQLGSMLALGGTGPVAQGGAGGTGGGPPTVGGDAVCGYNAAGGGGGVGRIAASASYIDGGTVSPTPDTTLPL
jgi:hypothetical protein